MSTGAMVCLTLAFVAAIFFALWAANRVCQWADRKWPYLPEPDETWGMRRLTDQEYAAQYPALASRVTKWSRYR